MARSALIVASGPEVLHARELALLAESRDIVIAADGGADALRAAGVRPDVIVGDMDSVSPETRVALEDAAVQAVVTSSEKDASDLDLAIDHARRRGVGTIDVTGVSGGRHDHWLAALGALSRAADLQPTILAPDYTAMILSPSGRSDAELRGPVTFSLLALGGPAVLTCRGSRWELDHAVLDPMSSRGLSNYVVDDRRVRADIHDGVCLLFVLDDLSV